MTYTISLKSFTQGKSEQKLYFLNFTFLEPLLFGQGILFT